MASIKFPKEYIRLLKAVAADQGKTIKEYITDAVAAYMIREDAGPQGAPEAPEGKPKKRPAGRAAPEAKAPAAPAESEGDKPAPPAPSANGEGPKSSGRKKK